MGILAGNVSWSAPFLVFPAMPRRQAGAQLFGLPSRQLGPELHRSDARSEYRVLRGNVPTLQIVRRDQEVPAREK